MGDLITAEDLEQVYGEGDTATRALTAVSFGLQGGEFASLIGQLGSGKSTLLNLPRPARPAGFAFSRAGLLSSLRGLDTGQSGS